MEVGNLKSQLKEGNFYEIRNRKGLKWRLKNKAKRIGENFRTQNRKFWKQREDVKSRL